MLLRGFPLIFVSLWFAACSSPTGSGTLGDDGDLSDLSGELDISSPSSSSSGGNLSVPDLLEESLRQVIDSSLPDLPTDGELGSGTSEEVSDRFFEMLLSRITPEQQRTAPYCDAVEITSGTKITEPGDYIISGTGIDKITVKSTGVHLFFNGVDIVSGGEEGVGAR